MAISELSGKPPKVLVGGIFEELAPIQVEVKSVLKPELNMPVSIALSDKEYHHSPLYGMPVHPKVTLRHFIRLSWQFFSTPGWRDTLWVYSTMTRPGHEPRLLDLESSALTMRPSPHSFYPGGVSNIPDRVFLRFPEEGSWGISSGQRCFLPRLLSLPTFQTIYLQAWVTFCPAFWKFWRWSERLSRDSIWRPNQNSRADNPQYLVPNGHDHVSVWYSKMQP